MDGRLADRPVHDRGEQAQPDAEPPDRVVGAEAVVKVAAEPYAQERPDLMGEEHQTAEHAEVARAEHDRDEAVGRRHGGQPQEAHDDGEDHDAERRLGAGAGRW